MGPGFLQAPDTALRFLLLSAVNRMVPFEGAAAGVERIVRRATGPESAIV